MKFESFASACRMGLTERVSQALPKMDLTQTDAMGNTALILALLEGRTQIDELLIPGSDLRATNREGRSALFWAIGGGHFKLAKAMLTGSDPATSRCARNDSIDACGAAQRH